jgi:hypothetical protein
MVLMSWCMLTTLMPVTSRTNVSMSGRAQKLELWIYFGADHAVWPIEANAAPFLVRHRPAPSGDPWVATPASARRKLGHRSCSPRINLLPGRAGGIKRDGLKSTD